MSFLPKRAFSGAIKGARKNFQLFRQQRSLSSTEGLPEEVDAVVVGGGSLGASCAFHLQQRGLRTLLVERHKYTSGTTWHTAGMLWRLRPHETDVELHTYTRKMCLELEEETGVHSWTENGGLFIACNKERLAEYQRLAEHGKYYDIDSRVLSPKETLDVYPILNVDDVYGAMHSPTDGTIDAAGIVEAYKKAAVKRGAIFREHTAVTAIETEKYSVNGADRWRVQAVVANGQRIKTSLVVNCAGSWAGEIAKAAGLPPLPLLPMKHAYIVTDTMEGVHPGLPNMRDHDLSIYFKTQGDALALGGYEQNPEFWLDADPTFSFGLFDLDWNTFQQNLEGHFTRCPRIEEVGIKSTVCGPEAFTPDHKALVGPDVDLKGYIHCCGFNSMGMMLGGGVGREVAAWAVDGAPTVDMFSMDVSRFHPDCLKSKRWCEDRTHESYAKTYSIVFPHDEALAGRGMRKSALYDVLLQQGCVYQQRHGFERPGWFEPEQGAATSVKDYDFYGAYDGEHVPGLARDDSTIAKHDSHTYLDLIEGECTFGWGKNLARVEQECFAARNGVALFDQSYFGKFFVEGPEAEKAIDWIATAKFQGRAIGSVAYTALCNVHGGTEADLTITKMANDKFYIACGGSTVAHDWRWISAQLKEKAFECSLRDASDEYVMLSVQGPNSRELLEPLLDIVLDDETIPFSHMRHAKLQGHDLMVLRLTFVGELGFELHVPSASAVHVYNTIMAEAEGLKAKGIPVENAGYFAIDSMSAEKGFRHWHADLASHDSPLEAGIGFTAIPKLKTDIPFLGREALERQRSEGLKRKIVCLVLEDPSRTLHGRETIWRNGECVGFVRSTAFGFSVGAQIAYGYVDGPSGEKLNNAWLSSGTYHIGDRGDKLAAVLHLKAPFDPQNLRPKGQYELSMPPLASGAVGSVPTAKHQARG